MQETIDAQREELAALKDQIADLVKYLNSDKFSEDTTVQVVDILTRLGAR